MENLVSHDGTLLYNIKSYELDIFALNMVQKNSNDNLLVSMKYSKEDNTISYNIDGLIPISTILENSISSNDIIELLSKICDVIKYSKLHMLYSDNLILDIDYIFLDNDNFAIKMLYIPIQDKLQTINIRNFFKELMLNIETDDYLISSKIFKKINKSNFDFNEFMIFLESQNKNEVSNYETTPQSTMEINKVDKIESDLNISTLDDEDDIDINTIDDEDDLNISALDDEDDEISLVIHDIENTNTMLYHKPRVARIIREKDSTSKVIDKERFVIGKSEDTDFRILNNKYVSKIHATIITRGTDYYIMDNGSSNGTFVNNEYIEDEVKLKNNDIIILASIDEKIRFCLE